ncbi:MAG: thiamine phosphate synthase [Bacteroidia bacterium]
MLNKTQYISQGNSIEEQINDIKSAVEAGYKFVQLRFKKASREDLLAVAQKAKTICAQHQTTFIINDHVDIAKEIDADGVHLGLDDMNISAAKKILGDTKIIGGTANTLEHVLQRINEGCTYVGLGPFRFTTTKEKLSPILGTEGYKKITGELKKRNLSIPIYAIGGIEVDDVREILQQGIYGIAVSGVISKAKNKEEIVNALNKATHG